MCKIWGLPKALVVKTSLRPLKHPSQTGPSYSHFGIFVVLAGDKSLNHFLLTGHRQLHCTGALTGTINLNVMAAKSKVTPSLQWMMIKKNLNQIRIETHKDHGWLSPKEIQDIILLNFVLLRRKYSYLWGKWFMSSFVCCRHCIHAIYEQ